MAEECGINYEDQSPTRHGIDIKTQMVLLEHDVNTGCEVKKSILIRDWPKGQLKLTQYRNYLYALLEQ